jgi:hypothetical protein
MLQLIMARVWNGGNPAASGLQGLRMGGGIAGQTAKSPLRRQVIQELAKTGPWPQAKRSLQLHPIHRRTGMKQGILGIAPPAQLRRSHWGSQLQKQGRQIPSHLAMELQLLSLREGTEAPLAQSQGLQALTPAP